MGFARTVGTNGMFSQRHYEAVAKRLNNVYRQYYALQMEWAFEPLNDVARQLEDLFRYDNPNFKPDKFMTAVLQGVKDET